MCGRYSRDFFLCPDSSSESLALSIPWSTSLSSSLFCRLSTYSPPPRALRCVDSLDHQSCDNRLEKERVANVARCLASRCVLHERHSRGPLPFCLVFSSTLRHSLAEVDLLPARFEYSSLPLLHRPPPSLAQSSLIFHFPLHRHEHSYVDSVSRLRVIRRGIIKA